MRSKFAYSSNYNNFFTLVLSPCTKHTLARVTYGFVYENVATKARIAR